MVCEDVETIGMDAAKKFAAAILQQVEALIGDAVRRVESAKRNNIIVTGSGGDFASEFLIRLCPDSTVSRLSCFEGDSVDVVAPAWAVASLAKERHPS